LSCKRGGAGIGKRLAKSDVGRIRVSAAASDRHYTND